MVNTTDRTLPWEDEDSKHEPSPRNYVALRRLIGLLGLALPILLLFGGWINIDNGAIAIEPRVEASISQYYYTSMGNWFVGILFSMGVFLFTYRGYEQEGDNPGDYVSFTLRGRTITIPGVLAGVLAGFFAIGVAIFPTTPNPAEGWFVPEIAKTELQSNLIGPVHIAFAFMLFSTLIYFCLRLFPRYYPQVDLKDSSTVELLNEFGIRKLLRNKVYRICGRGMIVCIILLVAVTVLGWLPAGVPPAIEQLRPVFWLEAIMIWAFGIAWIVKGKGILKDRKRTGSEQG